MTIDDIARLITEDPDVPAMKTGPAQKARMGAKALPAALRFLNTLYKKTTLDGEHAPQRFDVSKSPKYREIMEILADANFVVSFGDFKYKLSDHAVDIMEELGEGPDKQSALKNMTLIHHDLIKRLNGVGAVIVQLGL